MHSNSPVTPSTATTATIAVSLVATVIVALFLIVFGITKMTESTQTSMKPRPAPNETSSEEAVFCEGRYVHSETGGVIAVIQGTLRVPEDGKPYFLYEFDGVREEPQIVGVMRPGDTFCFMEGDLDWGIAKPSDSGGDPVKLGLIRTHDFPKGVYAHVMAKLPTVKRDDGWHFFYPYNRVLGEWGGGMERSNTPELEVGADIPYTHAYDSPVGMLTRDETRRKVD